MRKTYSPIERIDFARQFVGMLIRVGATELAIQNAKENLDRLLRLHTAGELAPLETEFAPDEAYTSRANSAAD